MFNCLRALTSTWMKVTSLIEIKRVHFVVLIYDLCVVIDLGKIRELLVCQWFKQQEELEKSHSTWFQVSSSVITVLKDYFRELLMFACSISRIWRLVSPSQIRVKANTTAVELWTSSAALQITVLRLDEYLV